MSDTRANRVLESTLEPLLLLLIAVGLADTASVFLRNGFFPPPANYDTMDNFMDWFNPAYWANNQGAYDVWGTVYPPFAFVFLRIFSLKSCYIDGPFSGRSCDWLGMSALFGFYLANIIIIFFCYRLHDKRTALMRWAALSFGLPMIFAVDRGNLIVPCFTCFALGHGRLLRSARLRWLAVAMSINFKPYLLGAVVPLVLKRRWRWFEGAMVATVLVYVVSWAVLGVGSPMELIHDTFAFENVGGNAPLAATFYGSSYASLSALLRSVPLTTFVGSRLVEFVDPLPMGFIRFGQAAVLVAFLAAALRPRAVTTFRLTALAVAVALSTVEVGSYAQVFLLFLVFLERWKGIAVSIALICAYLLCVPIDHIAVSLYHQIKPAYLSGRTVDYDLGVTFGMFIRPGLILMIQYALAAATVVDVWRARSEPSALSRRPPSGSNNMAPIGSRP
jgi:hypothetical protein